MKYEFLREFPRRMKVAGSWALLMEGCLRKGRRESWKHLGFESFDAEVGMLLAIMLYIMDLSSKGENCTLDGIANFAGDVAAEHFGINLEPEACTELALLAVRDVLRDGGENMTFTARNFEEGKDEAVQIDFIDDKIVESGNRVSYCLSENGYSLLFGTLEVEQNLRFNIAQMIFIQTLEKSDYDTALESIREIFRLMLREIRRNEEAAETVRRGLDAMTIQDYSARLDGSLAAIRNAQEKLQLAKAKVAGIQQKFDSETIGGCISSANSGNVEKLKRIQEYLGRALDLRLDVLQSHGKYVNACDEAAESYWDISGDNRYDFSADIFDKVLDKAALLPKTSDWLRPFLSRSLEKQFALEKAVECCHARDDAGRVPAADLLVNADIWKEEMRRRQEKRNALFRGSLETILAAVREGCTTLQEIRDWADEDGTRKDRLAPSSDIFRRLLLELVRGKRFVLAEIGVGEDERAEAAGDNIAGMLRQIAAESPECRGLAELAVSRIPGGEDVLFEGLNDDKENIIKLACSNLAFTAVYNDGKQPSKGGEDNA